MATAAAVAASLIGLSAVTGGPPQRSAAPTVELQQEFTAGIPQEGIVLGFSAAPVTLVEFADL